MRRPSVENQGHSTKGLLLQWERAFAGPASHSNDADCVDATQGNYANGVYSSYRNETDGVNAANGDEADCVCHAQGNYAQSVENAEDSKAY